MPHTQAFAKQFSNPFEVLDPITKASCGRVDDCETARDARSALIHDEADLTIMFADGEFTGSLIARNGMRTSDFAPILDKYNLKLDDIVVNDLPFVTLFLSERTAAETTG